MDLKCRPIAFWDGMRRTSRRRSPFRAKWSATDQLLRRELRYLGVGRAVLKIDVPESQIRNDGWIRSDAKPKSPAVAVTFIHEKFGPQRYPCDVFTEWTDNVRAIALSLEALRQVDRYGVTKSGEQYRGFKSLPPATPEVDGYLSTAAVFIAEHAIAQGWTGCSKDIIEDITNLGVAYKFAAMRTHPDRNNGNAAEFVLLQKAVAVLDKHHLRSGEARRAAC